MENDTKSKVLIESLRLFAEKGYNATSVQEIASAVGIKAPSLYNHFKSKKHIFDGIVEMMMGKFSHTFGASDMENMTITQQVKFYGEGGEGLLKEMARNLFDYYLTDTYASQFKKMLAIEKYSNSSMDDIYTKIYIDSPIRYQAEIFREMIKQKYFKSFEPEIMAYHFFSPVLVLLDKYSCCKEKKADAFLILDKHIEQFNSMYKG